MLVDQHVALTPVRKHLSEVNRMSSDEELNEIGVLKRREIEARLLAPIVDALGDKFGRQAVLEVVRDVVTRIARGQGRELATRMGRNDVQAYGESVEPWTRNDALQLRILDQNESVLNFDVTRCRYAELYRSLGIEELGSILSCNRDAKFIEGFNGEIALEREHTILQGFPACDFRYSKRPASQ
jgi:L-2-amino-thiazoline-4-carboxylic acid hydrolase